MNTSAFRVVRRVALTLGGCLLTACGDSNDATPSATPSVVLSPTTLTIAAEVNTGSFTLDPGGAAEAWSLVATDSWLNVSPNSGTGVATVTVTVNRDGLAPGSYTAAVQVTARLGSPILPVTTVVAGQAGPQLSVAPASLAFGTAADALTFAIANSGAGTLTWSAAEMVTWARVSPRSGTGPATVTVTIDRSLLSVGTHTGTVRVTSNAGAATIPITVTIGAGTSPTATPLSVSPSAVVFGDTETSRTLALTASSSSVAWTATASAPWLTVAPASGSGSGQVTVTLDRNQLGLGLNTATITLTFTVPAGRQTGANTLLVPISVLIPGGGNQPQLAVSPASLAFAAGVSQGNLGITNLGADTLDWTVQTSAAWITAAPASGSGNATVVIAIDRNHPDSLDAAGTVTVNSDGGTASVPLTVVVGPGGGGSPALGVSTGLLDFGGSSTQLPLTVRNDGGGNLSWTATPNQPWVSVAPGNGTNTVTATVTIDRNQLGGGTSNGLIQITSNAGSATVVVSATQPGGSGTQLQVIPTALLFGSSTTMLTFTILKVGGGTLTWTASPSQAWITASPSAGTDNQTVTVTVNRGGLGAGDYNGVVAVQSNGGNANIAVTMTVP